MPPKCQPMKPVHPAEALSANLSTENPKDHINKVFTRIRVIIAPKVEKFRKVFADKLKG